MSTASLRDEIAGRLVENANAQLEAAAIVDAANGVRAVAFELAARRAAGAPLGLVTGRVSFLGIELLAEPGVLVPRPETELLGATVVRLAQSQAGADGMIRIIDMGCGAGNLTCAIAAHVAGARVYAADISPSSVRLTRRNAERLGLGERVQVAQGDLFTAFTGMGLEGTIDVVVCNPPYISTGRLGRDRLALLDYEPRAAFDAGPFGIAIQQRVIRDAPKFLKPKGWLALEVGLGQDRQVETLFARAGTYEPPQGASNSEGQRRVIFARLLANDIGDRQRSS